MTEKPSRSALVYNASDPVRTRRLCSDLESCGAAGRIAAWLFRAQKSSERAKCYRGGVRGVGSYRDLSYARKSDAMRKLCAALEQQASLLDLSWGWKLDPAVKFGMKASWVLYVDLPEFGQVSFHSPDRFAGPNYGREWDGAKGRSPFRIVQFCDAVLAGQVKSERVARTLPLFAGA